jgi:hypothetical protein
MMKRAMLTISLILAFCTTLYSQVTVTEFLPDPAAPLESEWVEIYNPSDQVVDLAGWSLCDLVGCGELHAISADPKEYIILCQDSASFCSYYNLLENEIHEISGWRALNNGGDLIMLKNPDGTIVDSIVYKTGNGNNISWEKIDYSIPGWDSENWHQSLDSTGSTPGRKNSVSGGFPSDFELSLLKKVFAPGSGGEDKYLAMEIKVPRDCYLTLTVYSLDGRKIRTIYDKQMLASGEYFYDGRHDDGNFLHIGMYILLARVGGECSYSEKYAFGVAKK